MIRKLVPFLFAFAFATGGILFFRGLDRYAEAQGMADAPALAPLDAGPSPVAAPTVTVVAPATSDIAISPQASADDPLVETHVIVAPAAEPDPASFTDTIITLWRRGAFAPAVLLAAFAGLLALRKWVPKFREGKLAAYSAVGVTALATLVEPCTRGTTPTAEMVMTAVVGAILLTLRPHASGTTSGELGGDA